MMRRAVILLFIAAAGCASANVVDLGTRPGVVQSYLLVTPQRPVAAVVLIEGGPGIVDLAGGTARRRRGFFSGNFERFASHGLAVALMDAPSDRADVGLRGRDSRTGPEHLRDIAAVIARVRKDTGLPVWLAGISLGSVSAAYYAIRGREPLDGLVLASAVTRGGKAVTGFRLERITAPVLVLANRDDGCRGTPPEGAQRIVAMLVNSRKAEARYVRGGIDAGRHACAPQTPHTFYGIEAAAIAEIADFITRNSPGARGAAARPAGSETPAARRHG